MDVSIIIVSYNTRKLTRDCLISIYAQTTGIEFEVIVSDNGSADGSVEMIKTEFPEVLLVENNENLGFGAANNRASEVAKGKYLFFLNSDTILLNNAVKFFFDYWETSSNEKCIGALGTVLLDGELKPTHSGGKFPSYKSVCNRQILLMRSHFLRSVVKLLRLENLFFRIVQKRDLRSASCNNNKSDYSDVEYITGADLFMKNNSLAKFDESFFLYYEETDLEFRLAPLPQM